MAKRQVYSVLLALAAVVCAAQSWAKLKYEPSDYAAQDALVVHLDGIRNVGANAPHDPNAKMWINLANANNPANIVSNPSSGWRNGVGYYFCWDGSASHATLASAAPAMTQATFEFVFEGDWNSQSAKNWGPHFISGDNDQKICMGAAATPLIFKEDAWTGDSTRPQIANWSWKQASFSLGAATSDGNKGYDQGVLKTTTVRTTAAEGSIPATAWMIGQRRGQVTAQMQLTGIMKSVRIYNRALAADEVAQNAAIDAARFDGVMPVTNAVIATSVAGANGYEVPGVYAVDGSHVFTARPSATVGNSTYACTGYAIEKWENGAWGASVVRDGIFAVEVSENEKVRITWNWEAATGTLTSDIDAYSTDGIKVWYDGIRNNGVYADHESAANHAWRELVSNASANMSVNDNSHWTSDGYYFAVGPNNGKSYAYLRQLVSLGTVGTIEISCDTKASDQTASWPKYLTFGYTSGQWGVSYENGMAIQVNLKQTYLRLQDDAWTGNTEAHYAGTEYANWNYRANTTSPWDGKHAAFVVDTADHRAYKLGVRDVVKPRAEVKEMPAAYWIMGNTYYNGTTGNDQLVGTMKAVRAYSRVLSDAEISRHYSIDVWRFDGVMPLSNAVEVVADARGLSGREAADVYFPQGGWTFNVGGERTVGGATYSPAGYVVETWDQSTSTWRVEESSDSATTWTSPSSIPFASRRLTWKWRMVRGIRSAADYTVHDYAPGGMVVWYDGICNDGIGAAHVSDGTHKWRELVSGEQANMSVNDNTFWTDDGYRLALGPSNEKSYFYLNTASNKLKSLGTIGTMEIACDVKGSEQVGSWPCFLSFGHTNTAWAAHDNDMSIHSYGTSGDCRWKTDTWTGGSNRANITQPWDGKHAAFVMDTAQFRSYKRGEVDQTQPRPALKTMPPAFFFVGNKYYQSGKSNAYSQLVGTMKAVRAYSRVLSDAEIAHNYKVDVARFDGLLTVTNVVVAGKHTDYEGLAAGAYEVVGTGEFTAGPATDKEGKVRKVVGYTIETWDASTGTWGAPVRHTGDSYTASEGSRVRLTWKWEPDGLKMAIF